MHMAVGTSAGDTSPASRRVLGSVGAKLTVTAEGSQVPGPRPGEPYPRVDERATP